MLKRIISAIVTVGFLFTQCGLSYALRPKQGEGGAEVGKALATGGVPISAENKTGDGLNQLTAADVAPAGSVEPLVEGDGTMFDKTKEDLRLNKPYRIGELRFWVEQAKSSHPHEGLFISPELRDSQETRVHFTASFNSPDSNVRLYANGLLHILRAIDPGYLSGLQPTLTLEQVNAAFAEMRKPQAAPKTIAAANGTDVQRMLLVDDDQSFLEEAKAAIEARYPGIEIVTAKSGVQVRRVIAAGQTFDAVITDFNLGSMDGIKEVAEVFNGQNHPNTVPVMVWSRGSLIDDSSLRPKIEQGLIIGGVSKSLEDNVLSGIFAKFDAAIRAKASATDKPVGAQAVGKLPSDSELEASIVSIIANTHLATPSPVPYKTIYDALKSHYKIPSRWWPMKQLEWATSRCLKSLLKVPEGRRKITKVKGRKDAYEPVNFAGLRADAGRGRGSDNVGTGDAAGKSSATGEQIKRGITDFVNVTYNADKTRGVSFSRILSALQVQFPAKGRWAGWSNFWFPRTVRRNVNALVRSKQLDRVVDPASGKVAANFYVPKGALLQHVAKPVRGVDPTQARATGVEDLYSDLKSHFEQTRSLGADDFSARRMVELSTRIVSLNEDELEELRGLYEGDTEQNPSVLELIDNVTKPRSQAAVQAQDIVNADATGGKYTPEKMQETVVTIIGERYRSSGQAVPAESYVLPEAKRVLGFKPGLLGGDAGFKRDLNTALAELVKKGLISTPNHGVTYVSGVVSESAPAVTSGDTGGGLVDTAGQLLAQMGGTGMTAAAPAPAAQGVAPRRPTRPAAVAPAEEVSTYTVEEALQQIYEIVIDNDVIRYVKFNSQEGIASIDRQDLDGKEDAVRVELKKVAGEEEKPKELLVEVVGDTIWVSPYIANSTGVVPTQASAVGDVLSGKTVTLKNKKITLAFLRSVAKSFTPGPGQSYASVQIYNSADTNATPYTSWLARSVDGEVQIIGDKPYGKQIGMEVFTSIRRNSTYEATFKDGILILKPVVSASAIGTSVRADFKRVLTEMKEAGTPLTYIIEGVTRLEDDSKLVRNDGKQISVVSDTAVKIENASASEDSGQGTSARAKIARAQRGIPVHYWVSFDHIAFVGTSEEADKYVKDPKAYREAEIKATEDGSTTTASANGFGPSYPALVNVPGVVLFSFDMPGKGYLVVKCLGNAGEDKNKFHFLFKDPENKDKVPFAKVASYLSTGTGASKIDAVPEVVQQVITYMTEYLVAYYNEHNISFEETSSSAELKAVNINAAYAITFKGDTVDGKRPPLLTIGFTYNPEGKPATIIVTTRDKGAKEFPIPQTADAAAIGEAEIARVVDLCAGQYSSNEDFKTAVADYLRDQASLVDSIKVLTGQQIVNVDDASSTVACASEKARVILIAAKSAAEHGLDRLGKAGVESYLEAHGNPQQAAIAVTWIKSENREINDRKAYEILSQAKESYESIIVGLIRDFTIVQGWLGTFQMSLIEDADPDKIEAFNRLCDSVNSVDANKWDKGYQRFVTGLMTTYSAIKQYFTENPDVLKELVDPDMLSAYEEGDFSKDAIAIADRGIDHLTAIGAVVAPASEAGAIGITRAMVKELTNDQGYVNAGALAQKAGVDTAKAVEYLEANGYKRMGNGLEYKANASGTDSGVTANVTGATVADAHLDVALHECTFSQARYRIHHFKPEPVDGQPAAPAVLKMDGTVREGAIISIPDTTLMNDFEAVAKKGKPGIVYVYTDGNVISVEPRPRVVVSVVPEVLPGTKDPLEIPVKLMGLMRSDERDAVPATIMRQDGTIYRGSEVMAADSVSRVANIKTATGDLVSIGYPALPSGEYGVEGPVPAVNNPVVYVGTDLEAAERQNKFVKQEQVLVIATNDTEATALVVELIGRGYSHENIQREIVIEPTKDEIERIINTVDHRGMLVFLSETVCKLVPSNMFADVSAVYDLTQEKDRNALQDRLLADSV